MLSAVPAPVRRLVPVLRLISMSPDKHQERCRRWPCVTAMNTSLLNKEVSSAMLPPNVVMQQVRLGKVGVYGSKTPG